MSNFRKATVIIILVCLMVIAGALYAQKRTTPLSNLSTSVPSVSSRLSIIKVTEKVDYDGLKPLSIATTEATPSATVLDVLNQTKPIEVKKYSFGTQVLSIDGVDGSAQGLYWLYSVNGKEAQVGADQYTLHSGDTIEWQLSKGQ